MNRAFCAWRGVVALCAIALLNACASNAPLQTRTSDEAHWQGKLAVRVFSKPPQAFFANFDLQGRPSQGELVLTSPLGTTVARMRWDANSATLDAQGGQRSFSSVQELAQQVTGADLPVASLFAWLQGIDEAVPGWQADLQDAANGRISAKHIEEVQSEVKIILER